MIIITYILLFLFTLFPILIWGYIFSYIDQNAVNRKRFLIGIVAGALSVFPILYLDDFINGFNLEYLNIFYYISNITSLFSVFPLIYSLNLFLLFVLILSLILGGFIHKFKNIFSTYFKNILVFLVFVIFLSFFVYFSSFIFDKINLVITPGEQFGDIVFNSFKLVFFYYLLVSFIEETSKHFNFLQSSVLDITDVKIGVMYSIFVALGFSLVENILYFYNFYSGVGFSSEFLKLYFFRSVFSVIVHVTCSSIIAYYFSKAYILYNRKDLSIGYLKLFMFGIIVSVTLHLIFNLALSLGYTSIMFIYFVGGYLYVSSIFYRE